MTKVRIELSDATARAAREAGLLTSEVLERLLTDAIRRRQAADELLAIADRVAGAGIEPMPLEEINREVKAARAERRRPRVSCPAVATPCAGSAALRGPRRSERLMLGLVVAPMLESIPGDHRATEHVGVCLRNATVLASALRG
jgi:hypothetical protein